MHTVTVGGMAIDYITQSDVARELGISRHLLGNWRRIQGFPAIEPDGRVHGAPVYRPERLDEIVTVIKAWEANRPGQGAGGGRPRKNPAPGEDQT